MLNIKKMLSAKPKDHEQVELKKLLTPWGEALDTSHVLEEHPTPQFARDSYRMLNGVWSCAFVASGYDAAGDLEDVVAHAQAPARDSFDQRIVVPFSPEAPLSQVNRQLQPDELLWYRRDFESPAIDEDEHCLLHFQGVDYACAVYVNGKLAGTHAGAYLPFSFDVTDMLSAAGNELLVCVADPSEFGAHLRGKQRLDRGDIWYTAQSGIWQPVWMELVAATHIESIVIDTDLETGILAVAAMVGGGVMTNDLLFGVRVFDCEGREIAAGSCEAVESVCAVAVHVNDVHAWSPADPYLYTLEITLGKDVVHSYCAFRSVCVKDDGRGAKRVYLNGEPLFIRGVLDQGYWSDGLMTAPCDEALVYDIESMRACGFNLLRKHIKVESPRWYYHCDRLGMLVVQDMVSGGDAEIKTWQWSHKPTIFKASWSRYRDDTPRHQAGLGASGAGYREEWIDACNQTVRMLGNHPCIIAWSLFNEGWGQFNARMACEMVRHLDATRLIDAASGWYDQRCGDFFSVHNYFRDLKIWKDGKCDRAFFISEFGGLAHHEAGHSALASAYGYELYERKEDWKAAFAKLIEHMDSLEEQGLAGYVYTQVSDVEEEVNGILTYDRRINKLE